MKKYSVFFGVAMENQNPEKLRALERIVAEVESKYGSVFYGPRLWPSPDKYATVEESFQIIHDALKQSELFVLYYPEKVVSGSLTELGMALGMNIPTLIFTENVENITYFMRAHKPLVTDVRFIMPWVDEQLSAIPAALLTEGETAKEILAELHSKRRVLQRKRRLEGLTDDEALQLGELLGDIDEIELAEEYAQNQNPLIQHYRELSPKDREFLDALSDGQDQSVSEAASDFVIADDGRVAKFDWDENNLPIIRVPGLSFTLCLRWTDSESRESWSWPSGNFVITDPVQREKCKAFVRKSPNGEKAIYEEQLREAEREYGDTCAICDYMVCPHRFDEPRPLSLWRN